MAMGLLFFTTISKGQEFFLKNIFSPPATSSNSNNTNKIKNIRIASSAENYIGKHYRRGVSAQCAAFVGHIVSTCGYNIPSNYAKCTSWLNWGNRGSINSLRRGDIIIYSKNSSGYNHIGIYDGHGKIIHRPTRSSPVKKLSYNYRSIIGIRRPS
jgi:cell wall-associated NlpC family hydrolase